MVADEPAGQMEKRQEDPPRTLWPLISLIPGGLGAWAPIYAGSKARRTAWVVWGVIWTLLVMAGWIAVSITAQNSPGSDIGTAAVIVGWIGSIATSFTVRSSYRTAIESPFAEGIARARLDVADRERARAIASSDPQLALQAGIGRPDLPGAASGGLVDVNNAPAGVLETLPGVDDALATRIIEARAAASGFESLHELGMVADLDGDLTEGLRDYVVFLPRADRG
jgi:Helix-hairpin-helix motif